MIKNLIKTTIRGYLRNKTFTTLNFLSLVIGLFVAFICFSYITYETSYEAFHENKNDTFRLVRKYRSQNYSVIGFPNYSGTDNEVQQNFTRSLKNTSSVKRAAQFIVSPYSEFIKIGDKEIEENEILSTNTPGDFIDIFTWQPIAGSLKSFESGFNQIILTRSVASKIVSKGFDEIIGQTIDVAGEELKIAAVIEDVPKQSHFNFNVAISVPKIDYWGSRVYVERSPNTSEKQVTADINEAVALFDPKLIEDELYKGHYLQAIEDIHLKSNILYETKPPGNTNYIYFIGIIGLLVLGIALFNYTNLSLALKTKQHKSIGINKVLGASRKAVIGQILFESTLLAIISVPFIALIGTWLIPLFNEIMDVTIEPFLWKNVLVILILAILLGIVAGIAPAKFYVNKKPINLFKSPFQVENKGQFSVRKYLIISQIAILICISSVSYYVASQLDFVNNKDLGFKKSGVIYTSSSPDDIDFFQEQLRQIPGISKVGNGSTFGTYPSNQTTYKLENTETVFDDANRLYLDFAALEIYDLKVSYLTNKSERVTIINNTAAERLANLKGISKQDLIGQRIITEPEYTNEDTGQVGFPVVIGGIFEDINLYSLHEAIKPYFITLSDKIRMDGGSIIAYDTKQVNGVMEKIEALYASSNQPFPLEYEFLEDNLTSLYNDDQKVAGLLLSFNIVAILLSIIGIIGISLFLALSKIKEIGIRKVLGATSLSIIQLSTKSYLIWVLIGSLIAWPITYYLTDNWLANFAYRIEMKTAVVPLIALSTLLLCLTLVSFVIYKISLMNPVKSLRSD